MRPLDSTIPAPFGPTLLLSALALTAGSLVQAAPASPGAPASPCQVSLVAPVESQVLYGMTELRAEASCPRGGAWTVAFLVDGQEVARAARPPFRASWDAGGSFAPHLVEARLIDQEGREARAIVATPGSTMRESVRVASTPIDRVDLSVSVSDAHGRAVHGVAAGDLLLEENGRPQRIETLRPESRPLSVAIVVDVSTSTRGLWESLRRAAPAFARTLGPEDAAKVVAFSGPAYLVQDFTHDVEAIERSLQRFHRWGGGTSLYDTLAAVGVELAWSRGGRQAVVLLTDGIDTLSRIDLPRLRNYLRRTDVTVETFLLRPPGTSSQPGYRKFERDLASLSRETGGEVRLFEDLDGIEEAFRQVGRDLQDRYELTYHSDRAGRPGSWRTLEVMSRLPGTVVRTRAGVIGSRDIGDCLVEDLRQGDAASRRKAAEWLGTMQAATGAPDALLEALADRSEEVRAAAAASLGKVRDPRALPPLVGRLSDPAEPVRRAASEALQSFGPVAVPPLLDLLQRGSREAQVKGIEALAAIGDPRALEAVTRAALPPPPPAAPADPPAKNEASRPPTDPRVRAWALWALGRLGRPESLPVIERGAIDPDPKVRQAALRALGGIDHPRVYRVLVGAIDDAARSAEDRAAARAGLVAAMVVLRREGGVREWALREGNSEAFLAIAQCALDDAGAGRDDLLQALGGAEGAVPVLEAIAEGPPAARADRSRALLARLQGSASAATAGASQR